ncbi:CU044_5270 family protein [Krasilnikovia sp. M28-CT-15]|uniref:CU044_5270 family protein n=1 Tax=Krasilnikovia sp. M28-CT-15 TaxID=3373540 RepID=UPI00387741D1
MPEHDNLYRMWPEQDLDAALAAFRSDVPTDERALAAARADLMAAAGAPNNGRRPMTVIEPSTPTITDSPRMQTHRPRRTRRWVMWTAAAAAVAAGALVAPSLPLGGRAPIDSAAAAVLTTAAAKIDTSDRPIQPGQYRYLASHRWNTTFLTSPNGKNLAYISEKLDEVWVPSVWSQQWMTRSTTTGKYKWIVGTEQEAKAAGVQPERAEQGPAQVAPCGDFNAKDDGRRPCVGLPAGGWQTPTEEWMAALPRDPHKLLERLRADAPGAEEGNDRGDVELLVYAADALRTGLLPADLRAALYRALALVPALKVVESSANLDGRIGTALGMDTDGERHDILIDPATGEFIGERQTNTRAADGVKADTTTSYTAVSTSTVHKIGATPRA